MQIAIIGAGIVGIATAHALLDEGHEVTLIDRGEPGAATSRGNAGWIAHVDIEPLASPRMILQVAGWLRDPLGPLSVRPRHLPTLAPWLARFLWAGRPSAVARLTDAIASLQSQALPAWERRLTKLDLMGELVQRGALYAFDHPRTYGLAHKTFERQRALGIDVNLLDAKSTRFLEPALSDAVIAAAHYPKIAHVKDPFVLATKLAAALRQRGGNFEQTPVRAVGTNGDAPWVLLEDGRTASPDRVIIAAGVWSKAFAAALGDRVPLEAERGYNATMTEPGVTFTRPVLFQGHGFIISPLQAGLRIGGAVELASADAAPNWARAEALFLKAKRFVPALRDGGRTDWMGCRPSLPDSLPVIGRSRRTPRALYAFGHSHHGLTQAAATAELIAAVVAGRTPAIDLEPYRAQRF